MKATMDSNQRFMAFMSLVVVLTGLVFLYSFYRQSNELSTRNQSLTLSFQKCEQVKQKCNTDLTTCAQSTLEFQILSTKTTQKLTNVQQEVSMKQQELQELKESSGELKRLLDAAREDSLAKEKELSKTAKKLHHSERFTKRLIKAVNSSVNIDDDQVDDDVVSSIVSRIHAIKNDIKALEKKIAGMTSNLKHSFIMAPKDIKVAASVVVANQLPLKATKASPKADIKATDISPVATVPVPKSPVDLSEPTKSSPGAPEPATVDKETGLKRLEAELEEPRVAVKSNANEIQKDHTEAITEDTKKTNKASSETTKIPTAAASDHTEAITEDTKKTNKASSETTKIASAAASDHAEAITEDTKKTNKASSETSKIASAAASNHAEAITEDTKKTNKASSETSKIPSAAASDHAEAITEDTKKTNKVSSETTKIASDANEGGVKGNEAAVDATHNNKAVTDAPELPTTDVSAEKEQFKAASDRKDDESEVET